MQRRKQVVPFLLVLAGHAVLLWLLLQDRFSSPAASHLSPLRVTVVADRPPPPPQARLPEPRLRAPATVVPVPDVVVRSGPPVPPRETAVLQPRARPGHAASGLGVELDAGPGGGTEARAGLDAFDAAVKARILAAKRMPAGPHGWCVVGYRVAIDNDGRLESAQVRGCADTAVALAARQAIEAASPFPRPPSLGASRTEVFGTLVFSP